jgi:hypothetical protein
MGDFDNIKVNDEVGYFERHGWRHQILKVSKVEHVTPTQFVAFNGIRFSRRNGRAVGKDYFGGGRAFIVTDKHREEAAAIKNVIRAEKLCVAVASLFDKARDEDAVRLAAMLPPELRKEIE